LLPRRRGGSHGSACSRPFFPRVLIHLVGLGHRVIQPALAPEEPGGVLEPVAQPEQLLAVAAQLAGELSGGDTLGDAAEDQHQLDDRASGALQGGAGEGVEDATARLAAVVEERGAVAAMDAQTVARPAPGAGQAVGVEPTQEHLVAGLLVHQFGEGEVHGRLRSSRGVGSASIPPRPTDRVKGLSTESPS
jgi:hypothetical protein